MNAGYQKALKRLKEAKQENSTVLNLSHLELTEIPPEVFEYTRLTELDLSFNYLTSLPGSIEKLINLRSIDLYTNELSGLPKNIEKLENLTIISLSRNNFISFPEILVAHKKLANLARLEIDHNQLRSVPEYLGKLTNLISLKVSFNQLGELPESIGKLTNLRMLATSNNQLEELPENIAKLTNLISLNVSFNQLEELPEPIGKLINLQKLDINNNQLTILPESIGNLNKLQRFEIKNSQLTTLPESIGKITNLKKLDISNNQLGEFPESIGKITNLRQLNISNNQLGEFPEFIGKLTNLTELEIGNNELTILPDGIGNLTNLTKLNLSGNKLNMLPEAIGKLTNLKSLNIANNQLNTLPEVIGRLINLKHFKLSENQITTLPMAIERLTNLTELVIRHNPLRELPRAVGRLTKLNILEAENNQLVTLPEFIGNLTNLFLLDLRGNQLKELPDSIGNLTKLKDFYISNNRLIKLPESIGQLTNLRELDISINQLTFLPDSLEKLTRLYKLELSDNHFKVGAEVYELSRKEQIKEILKWQRAQQAGTLQPIHEAKVIFIGESNYGKTHLIEWLKEGEITRKIKTTHGIERNQINISANSVEIRLNIWDLGGQEFMRSTHQFFFSERTLYVLVSLARRERNELNHWLKLVNQLGNQAPVLVVINKIDLDPHDLDRKSLERDYPNIIGFIRTCIKDCKEGKAAETLKALKNKIAAVVSDKEIMPGVFEQRPPDWFRVKNQLEKLEENGKDFITYEEYENLEFIKDLPEEDRKSNLKLLSMLGTVVSYVDDPRLIDTNVINPQWIMDGVYAIINDPKVKDLEKGRLHIDDLGRILSKKKFPKARHAYLLQLMNKFDICYEAKDQRDVYLIPDLFEDIEPDYDWEGENSMHFRYNYDDFSPDSFMTRFIVEMHQDILDDKRWRSGVYIANESCKAKVYQGFRKNHIHIEVTGNKGESRSYLYVIREAFRKLHKPFPQLSIKQEVLYKTQWFDYVKLSKFEAKNKPLYDEELDEDLPIVKILNGYSTSIERKGGHKRIEIFLASSEELKTERAEFEIFINRENKRFYDEGIFISLQIWEDGIDAMSQQRLQNEYNNIVKNCDIFICLFFTKVGKYTLEEFETAFGQFKNSGRPLIYTYFKNDNVKTGKLNRQDSNSLFDFQDKLSELGHFYTEFKNIDDLKYQFKNQLQKVTPKL